MRKFAPASSLQLCRFKYWTNAVVTTTRESEAFFFHVIFDVVFLAPLEFGRCSVWHYLDYRHDVFCICVSCVPQLPVKLPCSIRYMSLLLFCCCWHYLEIKVKGAKFSRAGDAELFASSPNNRAQYGDAPIASQEAHRHVYRVKPTNPTAHPQQGLVANVTVTGSKSVKKGAGRTRSRNSTRNLRMHTRLRNKPFKKLHTRPF